MLTDRVQSITLSSHLHLGESGVSRGFIRPARLPVDFKFALTRKPRVHTNLNRPVGAEATCMSTADHEELNT